MPITFESVQDPYGLRAASQGIAQGLLQRALLDQQEKSLINQEKRAEEKAMRAENRALDLKKQYGEVLGSALEIAQNPALPSGERLGALQNYISKTGDTSVLPLMKEIGKEAQTNQLLGLFGLSPQGMQNQQAPQQLAGSAVSTPQQPQLPNLSPEQLAAMAANPQLKPVADAIQKAQESNQRKFEADRSYHEKGAAKAREEARGIRASVPRKRMALSMSREAIESGEVGRFSWANIAERTGLKELIGAKGSQLITAAKENLLSNMSRVSARGQNQWFEQRLASMAPEVGKTETANLTANVMLEGDMEMDQAYIDAYDRLAKEDFQKYGYERNDIDQRAREEIKPIEDKIMAKTSYRVREIYESEKGPKWLEENAMKKVPSGTYLTPTMAQIMSKMYNGDKTKAVENAKKLGYKIPTRTEVEEWR